MKLEVFVAQEPPQGRTTISIDLESGTTSIFRSGRLAASYRASIARRSPESALTRLSFAPALGLLQLETTRGEMIETELPTRKDILARDGRPIIYLDQKDWNSLAKVSYAPGRVPDKERGPAEQVMSLARAKKIILPVSAAHLLETGKWASPGDRYQLGLTLATLSRGWQMRDPISVRRLELRESITSVIHQEPVKEWQPFTLDPNVMFVPNQLDPYQTSLALPDNIVFIVQALTSVSAWVDTILDADDVAVPAATEWTEYNQKFTDWLANEQRSASVKQASTDALLAADLQQDLAEAALAANITPEELSAWFQCHWTTALHDMPHLGLYREAFIGRHLDGGTMWKSNDLTDLLFLTCAAGYADFVVGERAAISLIQQAQRRLSRPINVFRRLSDLIPALRDAGIR